MPSKKPLKAAKRPVKASPKKPAHKPAAAKKAPRSLAKPQPKQAAPKAAAKAAKPAKAKAVKAVSPDEATFVGSQVCAGCHARQAAAFAQTLMGKIGKVRKGTMECENCHGAGSLHVAGGGGRGVGGMISFRADDPTHTVEETNAICLQCHEKGERVLWRGSTHGGAVNAAQSGAMRPVPGWANYRMPINGLYQTGACTAPGGAVTGMPGRNAAAAILKDLGTSLEEVVAKKSS